MTHHFLKKEKTGLWVVDVQEKLFPHIDRACQILDSICFAVKAARALNLSLFVTEQAPDKLGKTIDPIKRCLPENQPIFSKTAFSGYYAPDCVQAVDKTEVETWILVGIEAHICILQTAKDLLGAKKNVVILNDAISSRSVFDFSTAIAELRDCGASIRCAESAFYDLVRDADSAEFKALLPLVREHAPA